MIEKFDAEVSIDRFNLSMKIADLTQDFDTAIEHIKRSRESIERLENIVRQMKQESHDLTQDIYNKFKDKGFVKSIKY